MLTRMLTALLLPSLTSMLVTSLRASLVSWLSASLLTSLASKLRSSFTSAFTSMLPANLLLNLNLNLSLFLLRRLAPRRPLYADFSPCDRHQPTDNKQVRPPYPAIAISSVLLCFRRGLATSASGLWLLPLDFVLVFVL